MNNLTRTAAICLALALALCGAALAEGVFTPGTYEKEVIGHNAPYTV